MFLDKLLHEAGIAGRKEEREREEGGRRERGLGGEGKREGARRGAMGEAEETSRVGESARTTRLFHIAPVNVYPGIGEISNQLQRDQRLQRMRHDSITSTSTSVMHFYSIQYSKAQCTFQHLFL